MEGVPKVGTAGAEVVAAAAAAGLAAPPNANPDVELPPALPPNNDVPPAVPKAGADVAEGAAVAPPVPPNANGDAVLAFDAPAAGVAADPNVKGLGPDAWVAPPKDGVPNTEAAAAGVVVAAEEEVGAAAGLALPIPKPPKVAGVELWLPAGWPKEKPL